MRKILNIIQQCPQIARVLRLPVKALPQSMIVRILQGPCRGMKWVSGSGRISFWLGTYEPEKLALVASRLSRGKVFYDIGANLGIYTLAAARAGAVVYSFEPLPDNFRKLRRHIELNGLTSITTLQVAVSEQAKVATFKLHQDNSMGRLSSDGELKVNCVRLDDLDLPAPDCIKMDIEGAEAEALLGARKLLQTSKPVIFLATHGDSIREQCLTFLKSLGYRVSSISANGDEFIAEP